MKLNKQTITYIIIGILIVALICGVFYSYTKSVKEKAYKQGVNDAVNLVIQQMLVSLEENGYVQINIEDKSLTLVPYTENG